MDGKLVGHRLMDAGEPELALKSYYRAAAEEGFTADILSALGAANLRLGRLGQAERLLRRAIEADARSAAAWNNLGVVLMEQRKYGEAERTFRTAFALANGGSPQIQNNLRLALAKLEAPSYVEDKTKNFALMRHGSGSYALEPLP